MCASETGGYAGKILRVDLARGTTSAETVAEDTLRRYIGGTGLGIKMLYDEVPPGVEWSHPDNRLILASGPLGGTRVPGSGSFSVVTKGAMTEGATSTQANGFFGAYLKFCGYDAVVVQGAAKKLCYLYIAPDGSAEIRDGSGLAGKDTWDTEDAIKQELGYSEHQMSVFGIGPAGEHMVRFAGIVGDKGHIAAHNGVGAVMGAKKLKAVAVARGTVKPRIHNAERLSALSKALRERVKNEPFFRDRGYRWGTLYLYNFLYSVGRLPIKNYTTSIFPDRARLADYSPENIRGAFDIERHPCWACEMHHCHLYKVKEGPFAGQVAEEPEYEGLAAWSGQIGQTDMVTAVLLADKVDRLGLDTNESSWVIGFVMECYEKGILGDENTDGLKMTWGNVEAVRAMLDKIAHRQGVGDLLAEGVLRVANHLGGEALNLGVYTRKGASPRSHDHRSNWFEMFDTSVSDTGTLEAGWAVHPSVLAELGLAPITDYFSPEQVVKGITDLKWTQSFEDSMVTCRFCTITSIKTLAEMVAAATGWQFTLEEAREAGLRTINLLRAFNIRHGLGPELDAPSVRYSSMPLDGPVAGKTIAPHWKQMLQRHHELLGWDAGTGKPLPETLKRFGLEEVIGHIW